MGRVDDIAKRFSLAGVLDEDRQAKQRFPVEEIEVAAIEDHPANVAYSMDEDGIKSLAESIRKDGLTDIPMVRRKPDGGFQMLSGHRRKAAYALLAKDDPAFGRMPCRIVEGVSDDQAVTLLHTANYFTRELNVIERAKATQALGIQVERMRAENPELKGVRTAELKAAIIRNQTGRNVSPATIKRQEQTARRVEQGLTEDWRSEAIEGNLSDTDIATLAAMDPDAQARLYKEKSSANAGKADTSKLIREAGGPGAEAVGKLVAKALKTLRKAAGAADGSAVVDASQLDEIERCVRDLRAIAGSNRARSDGRGLKNEPPRAHSEPAGKWPESEFRPWASKLPIPYHGYGIALCGCGSGERRGGVSDLLPARGIPPGPPPKRAAWRAETARRQPSCGGFPAPLETRNRRREASPWTTPRWSAAA